MKTGYPFEDTMFLALKMEKETMRQGIQVAFIS